MRIWIESILARAAVLLILMVTAAACAIARIVGGLRFRPPLPVDGDAPARSDVVLVGTFYNDGWLRSHLQPLRQCEAVRRIFVIGQPPIANLETPHGIDATEKVRYAPPSEFASRLLGRTIARFLTLMRLCRRERPAVLMGYHIMPNALMCLMAARWYGLQAAYQMTGGPVQIIGGGVGSENVLLRRQRRASRLREWLMIHLVRQFDQVIVRGPEAARYIEQIGAGDRCHVVPGGVDTDRFAPVDKDEAAAEKLYDLVAVGRLVNVKRYDRMLRIVSELRHLKPDVRLAIVGDGPLREAIEAQIRREGLELHVELLGRREDVAPILRDSRAFILTSENEALSIAMMEAMAAGLPAIVPDVGELGSVVDDGLSGVMIDADAPGESAARIARLLRNEPKRVRMGTAARTAVSDFVSVESVARRWSNILVRSAVEPSKMCAKNGIRRTAGVVFAVALAVRLLFCFVAVPLLGLKTGPAQRDFFRSTDGYVNIAMNLADHGRFAFQAEAPPTTYRAPVYPALLAAVYALCGDAGTAVLIANCLASALTCVVLYWMAVRLLDRRVGFWMLSPAMFFPLSIYYCASSFSDTVLALFVVLYLYSLLVLLTGRAAAQTEPRPSGSGGRDATGKRPVIGMRLAGPAVDSCQPPELGRHRFLTGAALFNGIAFATAALTKAIVLPIPFVLLGYALLRRAAVRELAVATLIGLCLIGGWTARNYAVSSEFVPISGGTGYNALVGNFMIDEWADCDTSLAYGRREAKNFIEVTTGREIHASTLRPAGFLDVPKDIDALYGRTALGMMVDAPLLAIRKVAVNSVRFWYFSSSRTKSLANAVVNGGVLILALCAVPMLLRIRRADMEIIGVFVISFILLYAVIIVHSSRFSLPMVMVLTPMASVGAVQIGTWIREHRMTQAVVSRI